MEEEGRPQESTDGYVYLMDPELFKGRFHDSVVVQGAI
jgi:hypothetical protein